jgi:nucleoside-diphosphate-sugar epimerase
MKITITGASGFVGQNLSQYLSQQQHQVATISLRDEAWQKTKIEADVLIHLAGKAHDTANTSNPQAYFDINTNLTKRLFEVFLASDIKDFFYFSSVKATADTVDGVLDENHSSDPQTPYGQSKFEAEKHLLSQKLPQGKRIFVIRPCMIHGPGNKGNLNLLYKIVQKNMPWPLAAFDNQRSFLGIDNLNFLLNQMILQPISSGIYNLADDQAISTNQLINIIAKANHKKAKLWAISPTFIKTLAKIGDTIKLPLNSERLKKLTESYVVSNQKIKTALGLAQLPKTAEEGLIHTIQSFQNP